MWITLIFDWYQTQIHHNTIYGSERTYETQQKAF